MRILTFVCLLIVYSACLTCTDALWNKAKETYKKVEAWGKEHPVALTAIAVGASVLLGKRDEAIDTVQEALDKACVDIDIDPNVNVTDVIYAGFAEADANNNGELNEEELEKFSGIAAIVEYCKELKKTQ